MNRSTFIRRIVLAMPALGWLLGKQASADQAIEQESLIDRVKRLEDHVLTTFVKRPEVAFNETPASVVKLQNASVVKLDLTISQGNFAVPYVVYAGRDPNGTAWIHFNRCEDVAKQYPQAALVSWTIDKSGVVQVKSENELTRYLAVYSMMVLQGSASLVT